MEERRQVYLDNSATTRVLPQVAEVVERLMCREYGNPSSLHRKGFEAEQELKGARESLARILKVKAGEIVFTSGGTESDNLAILGGAQALSRRGRHLITTAIEHPAVMEPVRYLERQGYDLTVLGVDGKGRIRLEELEAALRPDTILVSIMHTNNEIGSVQPIGEIGALLAARNPAALFHVDAVQGFGKWEIHPKKLGVHLLSASSHKIHGPKGVGFLYVQDKVRLEPLLFGGGQQGGLRPGTENVPGVVGMARAAQCLYGSLEADRGRLYGMKERLIRGLSSIEDVTIHGPLGEEGAPHIISASFGGVRSEVLLHALEEEGIYVSSGSACSTHKPQPSATLQAIGLWGDALASTLRFSLSGETTEEEIDYTLEKIYAIIPMLRRVSRKGKG